MSDPSLPQGYSIRRTVQGAGSFFDVYMSAIGLTLLIIDLSFLAGFLILPGELLLGLFLILFLWLSVEHFKHWIHIKQAGLSFHIETWIISSQGEDVAKAVIQQMQTYMILRMLAV
jgi:hypothetical protein